jgi:hypothetical protein
MIGTSGQARVRRSGAKNRSVLAVADSPRSPLLLPSPAAGRRRRPVKVPLSPPNTAPCPITIHWQVSRSQRSMYESSQEGRKREALTVETLCSSASEMSSSFFILVRPVMGMFANVNRDLGQWGRRAEDIGRQRGGGSYADPLVGRGLRGRSDRQRDQSTLCYQL